MIWHGLTLESALAHGAAILAALGALISSLRTGKQVRDVRLEIDGRLDQLLTQSKKASFSEGREHERQQVQCPITNKECPLDRIREER